MKKRFSLIPLVLLMISCTQSTDLAMTESNPPQETSAYIVSVNTAGVPNAYTFQVGVRSPDTGCDQYADWWEVLSLEGELLYRRILAHSHVQEQPFVRSGGPIAIDASQTVFVRMHMNTTGYSMMGAVGSPESGFLDKIFDEGFAASLENENPLPDDCAF